MTGYKPEGGTPVINTDFLHSEVNPLRISSPDLDPDGISYHVMRWGDYRSARDKVLHQIQENGALYDLLVYPLRGGAFLGEDIARRFGFPVDVWRTHLYNGVQAKGEAASGTFQIKQVVRRPLAIKNRRILLADDVRDTATTLQGLQTRLMEMGAKSIDIVVLHQKPPQGNNHVDCAYVAEETGAWIVYPWEHEGSKYHQKGEFFAEKAPVWMLHGAKQVMLPWSTCVNRFLQIGFHPCELPSDKNPVFKEMLQHQLEAQWQEVFRGTDVDQNLINELMNS